MADVMVVDGGQLKRLMGICRVICSAPATIQQLQAKLKRSRRTIFRDLNCLEDLGIKVDLISSGYKIKQGLAACKKALAARYTTRLSKLLAACLK
jgi:predicted DNA-binding transcriptional regulator YafY